jgi:hypothetical protein
LCHACGFVIETPAAGEAARVAKPLYFAKLNIVNGLAVTADAWLLHRNGPVAGQMLSM